MKLTCPNNPEHKRFIASALISEIWLLDEDGDCNDTWGEQVVSKPELDEAECLDCGAPVILKKE